MHGTHHPRMQVRCRFVLLVLALEYTDHSSIGPGVSYVEPGMSGNGTGFAAKPNDVVNGLPFAGSLLIGQQPPKKLPGNLGYHLVTLPLRKSR